MLNHELVQVAQELEKTTRDGAFSWYDMMVFIPEVLKLKQGDIFVEIGVDKGRSLDVARSIAKKGVKLYGVDLQDDPKVPNTTFIQGDSYKQGLLWTSGKISLIHIDGDHSYEGCKADIDAWYPNMKPGGVMVFHDCDETSPGVMQAVAEFVNTHTVQEFRLFKDRWNTSMARIYL